MTFNPSTDVNASKLEADPAEGQFNTYQVLRGNAGISNFVAPATSWYRVEVYDGGHGANLDCTWAADNSPTNNSGQVYPGTAGRPSYFGSITSRQPSYIYLTKGQSQPITYGAGGTSEASCFNSGRVVTGTTGYFVLEYTK